MLIASGDADPVGNYGKGVEKVYKRLKAQNCDVSLKIYEGARHEILNEINRRDVYKDILKWLDNVIEEAPAKRELK